MLAKWQFNFLTALGAVALLLVIANGALTFQNRSNQALIGQRQQFVQQTVPLDTLYRDIVKALAEMAVKGNDRQMLDLLSAQGISVTVNGPANSTSLDASPRKADK